VTRNDRCVQRFASMQAEAAFPLRESGVILAGFNEMFDPWEVVRTAPDFHVVFVTQQGLGWVDCQGERRRAEPGECWTLPAGVAHRYGITKEPWKLFWFHLANAEPWRPLRPTRQLLDDQQARLEMLLDGYIREGSSDQAGARQAAHAYAQLIVYELRNLLAPRAEDRNTRMHGRLDRLWLDIQNDLNRDWRIEPMASRVHLSAAHFHRLVVKRYGIAPKKMLQKFRMERARELVGHPDYTLETIAEIVGYQSGYALSRAFKNWYGEAPAHFRKNCQS